MKNSSVSCDAASQNLTTCKDNLFYQLNENLKSSQVYSPISKQRCLIHKSSVQLASKYQFYLTNSKKHVLLQQPTGTTAGLTLPSTFQVAITKPQVGYMEDATKRGSLN